MKSLLILVSIFCNLCLGSQITNNLGERHYHDVQLYANYKEQSPQQGWSETVFPHPKDKNSEFIITYIEHAVSNLDEYPYTLNITSGGIGHKNVTVYIKKHDYGKYDYEDYDFDGWLEIYGVHESCYEEEVDQ